jgi:hypothetical protein
MAPDSPNPINGYTVKEMIALFLVPEVQGLRKDTDGLKGAVGDLKVEQGVIIQRLDNVATPDNCPIKHQVEELQVSVRDSSHEGLANSTFRIQTKAIFAAVIFAISTVSGVVAVILAHVLT